MSFPSDYKIVQFPGGTESVIAIQLGQARQVLVNTTDWSIHLMDGATPGGFKMVSLGNLPEYLQNQDVIDHGTRLAVEIAGAPSENDVLQVWSAEVIRSLFEKFVDTSTAGSWKVKDSGMPFPMRAAALNANDLNDATVDGFYVADPSSAVNLPASIPTDNNRNVSVLVIAQSVDNLIQVLYERDGSGKIWTRTRLDLVWGDWVLATGVTTADLNQKFDKTGGALSGDVDLTGNDLDGLRSINGGPLTQMNDIINGAFPFWQRGVSQSTSGYGSDDRWVNAHSGSTKVHTQQLLSPSVTELPPGMFAFSRTVVSSVPGAGNYVLKQQRIESVRTKAGKKVTLTFWAKADSPKDIAIEFQQQFGTGGSPSAQVDGIGSARVTLSTTWQKFNVVADIPSIATKTLGTVGNDALVVTFWFDAGSGYDSRTLNLGQQSGTFDLARVSLVEGDASDVEDPFPSRHIQQEKELCQRYTRHVAAYDTVSGYARGVSRGIFAMTFPEMRAPPTGTVDPGAYQMLYRSLGTPTIAVVVGNSSTRSCMLDLDVAGTPLTLGEALIAQLVSSNGLILDSEI